MYSPLYSGMRQSACVRAISPVVCSVEILPILVTTSNDGAYYGQCFCASCFKLNEVEPRFSNCAGVDKASHNDHEFSVVLASVVCASSTILFIVRR